MSIVKTVLYCFKFWYINLLLTADPSINIIGFVDFLIPNLGVPMSPNKSSSNFFVLTHYKGSFGCKSNTELRHFIMIVFTYYDESTRCDLDNSSMFDILVTLSVFSLN